MKSNCLFGNVTGELVSCGHTGGKQDGTNEEFENR